MIPIPTDTLTRSGKHSLSQAFFRLVSARHVDTPAPRGREKKQGGGGETCLVELIFSAAHSGCRHWCGGCDERSAWRVPTMLVGLPEARGLYRARWHDGEDVDHRARLESGMMSR